MIKVAKTKSFVVLLLVVVMEPPPGPACRVRTLHPGWETLDVVLTSEVPRKYQIMEGLNSMLWQWAKNRCYLISWLPFSMELRHEVRHPIDAERGSVEWSVGLDPRYPDTAPP